MRRTLQRAEFVVVQEAFGGTATCAFADLLLPATTWGEKEGTVTNSERRISRVRPAVKPPGATRHDWQIGMDFAQCLEVRLGQPATLFPYTDAESVWHEHRASTRGRDLDITGLSWPLLDALGPQQWPLPEGASQGKARLYEDGVFPTPDGRARFADTPYKPVAEPREARYPFSLNTGRLRDQWHGMSRTGTLGRLFGHAPEPVVQMHPHDMARRQLKEGDLVHVTSRRGSIVVPVAPSASQGLSQVFIAMHWGPEFLGGRSSTGEPLAGVNALTTPAFCPVAKQPELKHTPVKVLKAELPWSMLAMAWLPGDAALSARTELRALVDALPFASCVPFGDSGALQAGAAPRTGVLVRAAAHERPDDKLLAHIETLLGLVGPETLRYADTRRGQRRAVRLRRQGADAYVTGVLLAGDTRAESWIRALLQEQLPAQAFGRQLLSFQPTPPQGIAPRGKIVCNCFGVSESAIHAQLERTSGSEAQRLAALQSELKCGTNCGSCVPELQRMLRSHPATTAARPTERLEQDLRP